VTDKEQRLIELIRRLRRYARALTGNGVTADELVHDTLAWAWAELHRHREGTDLRAWLFTVMHNLYVNNARATRLAEPLENAERRLCAPRSEPLPVRNELRAGRPHAWDSARNRHLAPVARAQKATRILGRTEIVLGHTLKL
jgi:DNA-directed RNA polymerase specialized sigma24 family protein